MLLLGLTVGAVEIGGAAGCAQPHTLVALSSVIALARPPLAPKALAARLWPCSSHPSRPMLAGPPFWALGFPKELCDGRLAGCLDILRVGSAHHLLWHWEQQQLPQRQRQPSRSGTHAHVEQFVVVHAAIQLNVLDPTLHRRM